MRLVGPSGKPVLSAACFDANVKANHYRSAGKASSSSFQELPPGRFFADAHADVWRLQAAGALPLSSTGTSGLAGSNQSSGSNPGSAGDDADYELQAVVDDSCHPRITCARETSLCSSISDVCGVAAGVCSHGLPLLGCAIAMPAPERFLYYDLILSHLLRLVHLQLMYLDTGCSYRAHWLHHMPQDAGLDVIKIGWWHARGHGPGCFLKNSGLAWCRSCMAAPPHCSDCGRGDAGKSIETVTDSVNSAVSSLSAMCCCVLFVLLSVLQVQGGG
jgi:hypothetical protein